MISQPINKIFHPIQNCVEFSPAVLGKIIINDPNEILNAIKMAKLTGASLYPFSTGNNWGYGSKAPIENNCYLLDLSNLKKIHDFDDDLGIITLEPGVTYQELYTFISKHGNKWIVPVHGGGPDCSPIGNILERGFGITPIQDHFSSLRSIEAYLPDGSIYKSPFIDLGLPNLSKSFQWGVGPYLDGIFTQSNYGIITKASIQLARKPENTIVFILRIESDELLSLSIDKMRELQQQLKGIVSGINIMNQERMLSMSVPYPISNLRSGECLTEEIRKQLAKTQSITKWTMVGALSGPNKIIQYAKKITKNQLKSINKNVRFVDKNTLKHLNFITKFIPKINNIELYEITNSLNGLFNILNGIPQRTALKLAYWLNELDEEERTYIPDQDNCGLIWYSPIMECKGNLVSQFYNNMKQLSQNSGFENLVTFTSFDGSLIESTIPILFNKNVNGSSEKARNYYFRLLDENRKFGVFPYRLPTFAMSKLNTLENANLAQFLKSKIDPNNIISPGRYGLSTKI